MACKFEGIKSKHKIVEDRNKETSQKRKGHMLASLANDLVFSTSTLQNKEEHVEQKMRNELLGSLGLNNHRIGFATR
jgi:hypothetical protein